MRLLRTTSFRLTMLYVCVFALSACILGATVFFAARSALEEQTAARVKAETAFMLEEYRAGGLDRLVASASVRGRGASAMDYLVQSPAGEHLAGEIPAATGLRPGWRLFTVPEDLDGDGQPERVRALVTDVGDGLMLAVGDETWRIGEVEEAIATAFTVTVGVAAILGIGGGMLLSRAFLARVDAIARTAEAIIGGDLARRVPVRGTGDDLDRLAATLNRMLDRIGMLMESLRQVGSDVAHDLRTPLSRLYQRLEDARLRAETADDYEQAIDGALVEAEGLLATFAALLRIAQVEGASQHAGFRVVGLSGVMDSIADAYRPDAEEAGHRLLASIEPGIGVRGDRELLTQAVANLVENALRHTPPGTRIALRLSRASAGQATLVVEDDGPGVRQDELARLPHRFYRAERSRTTAGNGLGLTLVAAVAELHGSRLELADAGPGLRATLRFRMVDA
jgi:signal transduction histidine kinase